MDRPINDSCLLFGVARRRGAAPASALDALSTVRARLKPGRLTLKSVFSARPAVSFGLRRGRLCGGKADSAEFRFSSRIHGGPVNPSWQFIIVGMASYQRQLRFHGYTIFYCLRGAFWGSNGRVDGSADRYLHVNTGRLPRRLGTFPEDVAP